MNILELVRHLPARVLGRDPRHEASLADRPPRSGWAAGLTLGLTAVSVAALAQTSMPTTPASKPVARSVPWLPGIHPGAGVQAAAAKRAATILTSSVKGKTALSTQAVASVQGTDFVVAPYTPAHAPGDTAPEISAVEGDFDHDGCQDIVSFQSDKSTFMKGDCHGHFTNVSSQATAANVTHPIAVDVNHDGYPDIVAMTNPFLYAGSVVVMINQHDGTFAAPVKISVKPTVFSGLMDFNLVDVNGDGNPDVIISGTGTQDATTYTDLVFEVITGNADGTFNTAQVVNTHGTIPNTKGTFAFDGGTAVRRVGNQLYLYGLIAQSTTVDGVAFGEDMLYRWAVSSSGVVNTTSPQVTPLPTFNGQPNKYINLVDLNGDGILDFTLMNGDGMMYSALGKSDGTFGTLGMALPYSAPNNAAVVTFRDVDGDGIVDAVIAGSVTLGVWPGNGDGTFRAPKQQYMGGFGQAGAYGLVFPVTNHIIDDFDGDGVLDVAFFDTEKRGINFFKGNSDGTFVGQQALTDTSSASSAGPQEVLASLDLNGDGIPDIVVYNALGIQSGLGDGKGNFTYQPLSPKLPLVAVGAATADFNKDGKTDLVTITEDQEYYYHINIGFSNGDGTITAVDQKFPHLSTNMPAVFVGDINGDGYPDLLAVVNDYATATYAAYPMINDGKGNLVAGTPLLSATPIGGAALGDVNGDGKADLILNYQSGSASTTAVYLSDGSGNFSNATPMVVQNTLPEGGVYAADATGDGKTDILQASNGLVLYPGNGDGTFGAPVQIVSDMHVSAVGVSDLNGDGKPDIYLSNQESTLTDDNDGLFGLLVFTGNGDGTFAPADQYAIYGASAPLVPIDYLRTGVPSIFATNSNGTTILKNEHGAQLGVSLSAQTAQTGDSVDVTVSASRVAGSNAMPSGSVTVYEDGTSVGSATLSAAGSAKVTVNSLTTGTHSFSAKYAGDANYVANASSNTAALVVGQATAAFSLSSGTSSLAIDNGGHASTTINLAANGAFSGTVSLTCSTVPVGASCAFDKSQITLVAGQAASATLTLTMGAVAAMGKAVDGMDSPVGYAGLFFLPAMMFLRRQRTARRWGLGVLAALVGSLMLGGCGGSDSSSVAPGVYTLTVTATPSDPSVAPQTVSMIVNVKK